jgi:predicted DNA-binding transcriptional regulator AlpA
MPSTRGARQQGFEETRSSKANLLESGFMTVDEFAEAAHVARTTVHRWNCVGKSPARYRIGKNVFYLRADIETWLQGKLVVMN